MYEYVVTGYTNLGLSVIHFVRLPTPGESNFYRDVRSFNSFMDARYPIRRTSKSLIYFVKPRDEWEMISKIQKKHDIFNLSGKITFHYPDNVQSLYNKIGYGRKLKIINS